MTDDEYERRLATLTPRQREVMGQCCIGAMQAMSKGTANGLVWWALERALESAEKHPA